MPAGRGGQAGQREGYLKKRHLTIVGLSLLAAVSMAVGGCTKSDNGGTAVSAPSPSPSPADPKSMLVASVQELGRTTYKYHIETHGMTGNGVVDPAHKGLTMLETTPGGFPETEDAIVIGSDYWIRSDYGDAKKLIINPTDKYMHIDAAKLGDARILNKYWQGADLPPGLLSGLVDVKQVDIQHFTGIIDLFKARGNPHVMLDLNTLEKAGDKAKSAAFTASVDSQGRLTDFTVDMAALGLDQSLSMSYSDYGAPVTINKPVASKIAEASSLFYDTFKDVPTPSSSPSTK